MRIYLAWQYITGYSTSGMHALAAQGHDVRLMYQEALTHPPYFAPFDDAELTAGLEAIGWTGAPDADLLMRELEEFQPDVILFNSWHVKEYMKAARRWRGKALRIVIMDHQWLNTPKQWLGRLTRSVFIQPAFDAAFMPGDPQADFARRLGFKQHQIIEGLYTCEDAFHTGPQDPPRDSFLFVGRLVETKGVDVLAAAYRIYREKCGRPVAARGGRHGRDGRGTRRDRRREAARLRRAEGPAVGDGRVRLPDPAEPVRAVGRRRPGGGRVRSGRHLHQRVRRRVPAAARTATTAGSSSRTSRSNLPTRCSGSPMPTRRTASR